MINVKELKTMTEENIVKMKYGFPLFVSETDFGLFGSESNEKILVVDIFAFWHSLIKDRYKEKEQEKKLLASLALLEQAKNFYLAAEASSIKSKPLLYYYSFLNFVKIILIIKKGYEDKKYMHGISHQIGKNFESSIIKIENDCENRKGVNVATVLMNILEMHENRSLLSKIQDTLREVIDLLKQGETYKCIDNIEFCSSILRNEVNPINIHLINRIKSRLDDVVNCFDNNHSEAREKLNDVICDLRKEKNNVNKINIKDMLSNYIGIHRPYKKIYPSNETFFRLSDEKLYFSDSKLIFEAKIDCDDESAERLCDYYEITKVKDIFLLEVNVPIHEEINPNNIDRKYYYHLSQKIRKRGIWYSIKGDKYVMYISSNPDYRYTPEKIIYATMFYLGSITRYAPEKFDHIFSGKEQWLMSEFLTTQPKQFLYSLTSKIIGQETLKSYADF